MIIYGTGSTKGQVIQTDKVCMTCESDNSVLIIPYHRYFHLFWLPFFPIGTQYIHICEKCGSSVEITNANISPEIKQHIKKPKWHFIGLFIVVSFIAFMVIKNNLNTKSIKADKESYIENPAIGDIYEYKTMTSEYSLMKVVNYDDDSIYVAFNQYVASVEKGLTKLKKAYSHDYELESYGLAREYVKEMADDNTILKVTRQKNSN